MDPDNTSLMTKQYVAIVVAHELTHQWFGNLVTMRWWTDLWLNEGFASWMEYLAINHFFPEWDLWTQFAVDEQQAAMRADALEHTHPVEVTVNHPDEIRSIFDMISYQKGASMIHMLHEYLGAEPFRDGLRHYLKTHSYKNTDTVDLWQALEDVTQKPVKSFMGAWTSQSGFPILDVEAVDDHLKITQSKFVANPASKERESATIWPVPLLANGLDRAIIDKKQTNVPFTGTTPPIKLNVGQEGFYRVNYSHSMQQTQLEALDAGLLSSLDRMSLLADSFEITKAGYQPVNEYLELLDHFKNEDTLSVWEIIAGSIGAIRSVLSVSDTDDTLRDTMKPHIRELVQPQLARLGWDEKKDEPHFDTLLRPIIVGIAAGSDDESILDNIADAYKTRLQGGNIDPNMRGIVYSTAARKGGVQQFDELLNMYKETDSSDEKLSLTAGMTSFEQPELHQRVLDLIKSDTVRTQDNGYWIAYSFMNRHGRAATWAWMKDNWGWMKDVMGTDLSFSRMPIYAARNFADPKLIADYESFFASRIDPGLERAYNQGLEIAQTACAWRQRDLKAALAWFSS
jgi:puromycin-sensitive aminopeptidase